MSEFSKTTLLLQDHFRLKQESTKLEAEKTQFREEEKSQSAFVEQMRKDLDASKVSRPLFLERQPDPLALPYTGSVNLQERFLVDQQDLLQKILREEEQLRCVPFMQC